jgi:FkbM family methyltransferase
MIENIFNLIRKGNGYQFPRLGKLGHKTLYMPFRPRRATVEILPHIFVDLDLTDPTSDNIYYFGERYEFPTADFLLSYCAEKPAYFFDVGANFGYFSFAFEPNPATYQRLRLIIENNKIQGINAFPIGLADVDDTRPFYTSIVHNGCSTFSVNSSEARIPVGEVRLKTFETFLQENNLLDLPPRSGVAKIDAEGFDVRVLKGMRPALKRQLFRALVIEVSVENLVMDGFTLEDVTSLLEDCGYEQRLPFDLSSKKIKIITDNRFFVPRE